MSERSDFIIKNALIYDGTGGPALQGSVGVRDKTIAAVGQQIEGPADVVIDARGLALAPGFIDVHTHDDRAVLIGDMSAKVSQGVTTVVAGNCGVSLAPLTLSGNPPPPLDLIGAREDYRFATFANYLAALDKARPAVNVASLVGHSTLRVGVMDRLDRAASHDEIELMRTRLGEALDAGAIGLSTGLSYAPARHAPTSEISALAELLKPAGALQTMHMRDEGTEILPAMDEAFAVGLDGGTRLVISHFKVKGHENYGRSKETLARFDQQRQIQPLALDAYPYAASSTILDPGMIDEEISILITWSTPYPEASGRYLADLAREWGCLQSVAAQRLQPGGAVYFEMDEADVRRVLSYPETMIGSDGLPHDRHPHPRLWGSFPRVLGHYARDLGLFTLAEAIRRMTSLPAGNFGLANRGRIAPGMAADLVLFDPSRIIDTATFANPTSPSQGIDTVWVNGKVTWHQGRHTGEREGQALRQGN